MSRTRPRETPILQPSGARVSSAESRVSDRACHRAKAAKSMPTTLLDLKARGQPRTLTLNNAQAASRKPADDERGRQPHSGMRASGSSAIGNRSPYATWCLRVVTRVLVQAGMTGRRLAREAATRPHEAGVPCDVKPEQQPRASPVPLPGQHKLIGSSRSPLRI